MKTPRRDLPQQARSTDRPITAGRPMITRFRPRHYKGLNVPALSLGPVNLFLGPNNCGKSTLFGALSFLFDLFGRPEDARGTLQAALRRRSASPLASRGSDNPAVGFEWELDDAATLYRLTLSAPAGRDVTIEREDISGLVGGAWPFTASINRDDKLNWEFVGPEGAAPIGDHSPHGPFTVEERPRTESFLHGRFKIKGEQLPSTPALPTEHLGEILARIESVARRSSHASIANFVPADIAAPQPKPSGRVRMLDERGLNLVNLLFELQKNEGFSARLQGELEPLLPGLEGFYLHEGSGKRWLRIKLNGNLLDLAELSDGTVKMVALATMLFSPEPGATLCLDEPELNLHPAWARIVAGWIARQTAWEQILVSTHSPEILDLFTESFRAGAVKLFIFHRADRGYSVRPLLPAGIEDQLQEGWLLGDLYRVGEPAMGGWPW